MAGLVGLGLAAFLAGTAVYDLDCGGADECDGDGELAPLIGIFFVFYALAVGLALIAVAEVWRALSRPRGRKHPDLS